MPFANCRRCGRLFNRVGRDICPACVAEEERAFIKVRDHLRQHPNVTITELAEATGVDAGIILEMIRDGRLVVRGYPNMFYPCERCGQPVQQGRYCARCADELSQELRRASQTLSDRVRGTRGHGYFISGQGTGQGPNE
ncbi:hypothetical protein GCM10010885_23890 [Alicyclobacillus cellulosilyticus]|uniref:Flagellar operon protein (TIGR03826 family) n=1 Tax=Alicyclobacillus cellulosilyticus TaxID=1003997 RepID=A0A917KKX9_9BACL|nr:TIGR03826 family flagellar region protein [Alicyclobacillus cellulosilyticus]GGJ13760.1 hypothetical protein GCM10010885_23890 [Alicyclobacillus cellulosilyticus]